MFIKNDHKKIVFITKCNEKNCLKHITLEKKLSTSPKNGNPLIKNNGPSLSYRNFYRYLSSATLYHTTRQFQQVTDFVHYLMFWSNLLKKEYFPL